MAYTMFNVTNLACQEITNTFDMVWALDAGLWNLREDTKKFYSKNPNATVKEAKENLIQGLNIHGLNLKRITDELSWEFEEQYIAKLLLINATAIFDTWVDEFVDITISKNNLKKIKTIKKDFKAGNFTTYEKKLASENKSRLYGCFDLNANNQNKYIKNLGLIYKYFKSCRNCCAHGNACFTKVAEKNYKAIKNLTNTDCGLNEFPKIEHTIQSNPFKIYLRGVVGFYDVIIRIMKHFDLLASNYELFDIQLLKQWSKIPNVKLSSNSDKRNQSVRKYIESLNICPPILDKTDDVYYFLKKNSKK